MALPRPKPDDCDEQVSAVEAANRLLNRLQDHAGQALPTDAGPAPFARLVEELETAPEVETIREAAGDDPERWGAK